MYGDALDLKLKRCGEYVTGEDRAAYLELHDLVAELQRAGTISAGGLSLYLKKPGQLDAGPLEKIMPIIIQPQSMGRFQPGQGRSRQRFPPGVGPAVNAPGRLLPLKFSRQGASQAQLG